MLVVVNKELLETEIRIKKTQQRLPVSYLHWEGLGISIRNKKIDGIIDPNKIMFFVNSLI
jgi:hypothetical protein